MIWEGKTAECFNYNSQRIEDNQNKINRNSQELTISGSGDSTFPQRMHQRVTAPTRKRQRRLQAENETRTVIMHLLSVLLLFVFVLLLMVLASSCEST